MVGQISQITISPINNNTATTSLFEIAADSDEMFMPVLNTASITVVNSITANPTTLSANTGVSIR